MRDTAHNILVREGGACPWCGGTRVYTGSEECPEPDGAALAFDPWDDPEEEEDADALVLMALNWGDELRRIRTAQASVPCSATWPEQTGSGCGGYDGNHRPGCPGGDGELS